MLSLQLLPQRLHLRRQVLLTLLRLIQVEARSLHLLLHSINLDLLLFVDDFETTDLLLELLAQVSIVVDVA